MSKTLNDAIGCWTTNEGGLKRLSKLVAQSIQSCARATTLNDNPLNLLKELDLLVRRIDTMRGLAMAARERCVEIIRDKECVDG